MWITPRITDIFILNELRNVSLLVAMFHIYTEKSRKLNGIILLPIFNDKKTG